MTGINYSTDKVWAQIACLKRIMKNLVELAPLIILYFIIMPGSGYPRTGETLFDVRDFGAKGDGSTLNTKYLQAAIDSCYSAGGGSVFFPAGRFLTGSIRLKSNVFLELGSGATILGSKDISDFPYHALISADGASNVGIVGSGFVDGQGSTFWKGKERPYHRPRFLIRFDSCRNVRIEDINIRNSPRFNISLSECKLVEIHGISIINDRESPNTDGIDPDGSSDVFISDCYISTGDDAVCLKSNDRDAITSDIVVQNCVLETDDSALKCGTSSHGVIKDCTFNNIIIKNSRYGISLFMKDGGTFEGLKFSDIILQTETAAYCKAGRYSFPIFMDIERRSDASSLGWIRNISFDNIDIETYNGNCLFLGQPNDEIENVVMNNVRMRVLKRIDYSQRHKPRGTRTLTSTASNDYADISSHFTLAYMKDLTIRGLTIRDSDRLTDFERCVLWGKDLQEILIDGMKTRQVIKNQRDPVIEMIECANVTIRNCEPDSSGGPFLGISGKGSARIRLIGNDLSRTRKTVEFSGGASKESVQVLGE